MRPKSFKINLLLSTIRTLVAVVFPLITFPYASRILQVEYLGKISFSNSIISYFSLIAALGISNYAIREGARIRENKKEFDQFSSEVFSLNIIATLISYILLFFVYILVPELNEYGLLLLIQSSIIIFTTFGVDWIYSVYEDYFFITIRSIMFQIIAMVLLFTLVKTKEDYYIYALINVISSVGSNILNFINSRKYCKLKIVFDKKILKHLKPVFIIFATSMATVIYVNSDSTMLGFIVGDHYVGLYSFSVKIYSMIKNLLASILIVSLPRLSFYIADEKFEEYKSTLIKIFNSLILLLLPTAVGTFLLADEIILILSDKNYLPASNSLRILCIALVFSLLAWFINSSILLPYKKESYILSATIVGATINVLLNLVLIPLFQQDGAAITTAISEFLVFIIGLYNINGLVKIKNYKKNMITCIIGCMTVFLVSIILKHIISPVILYVLVTMIVSVIVYYLVLWLLRNELIREFTNGFVSSIRNLHNSHYTKE